MPRQEILSPGQHAQLLMLPTDARQIAECYTFSPADLDLIAQCRGEQNRMGFAIQLASCVTRAAWTPGKRCQGPCCGSSPIRSASARRMAGRVCRSG